MTSQVNIQGLITSTAIGTEKIGVLAIPNTVNVAASYVVPMSASTATIPVPATGATPVVACLIIPPVSSTVGITFKLSTNNADTGLPISSSLPTLLSFAATSPTSMSFAFASTSTTQVVNVKFW